MQRSPGMTDAADRNLSFPIDWGVLALAAALLDDKVPNQIDHESGSEVGRSAFEQLVRRLRRRHMLRTVFSFGIARRPDPRAIFAPGRIDSSDAAILLAFHAAGVRIEDTATALGLIDQRVGQLLFQGRQDITDVQPRSSPAGPCQDNISLLGWSADHCNEKRWLSGIRDHVARCAGCDDALRTQQRVNDQILAVTREVVVTPTPSTGAIRPLSLNIATMSPLLLIVLAVAVAFSGFAMGPGSSTSQISLLPQGRGEEHTGWLILSSETEVLAIDLESGERRRILESPAHDWWNPWILSPDSSLAVKWEERSRTDGMFGVLRAYDMQGELRYLHRWDQRRSRTFSGWLNNRTVLFHEHGAARRAGDRTELMPSALPSLIAVDLTSGVERELYRGRFDKAVPAPDGRHIAIVHAADTRWPGKTIAIYPIDEHGLGVPVNTVKHRVLGWPGRIVWSGDGETVFLSLIDRDLLPDQVEDLPDSIPGPFDFERVIAAGISVDGSVHEFPAGSASIVTVQAASPDGTALSVLATDERADSENWRYGLYPDRDSELILNDESPHGGNWWNSEVAWSPGGERRLIQQLAPLQLDGGNPEPGITSLVLMEIDSKGELRPAVVFHDALAIGMRFERGLALLRWVPNEQMVFDHRTLAESPQPGTPRQVTQADGPQQLFGDSEVAPSGRHILLHEDSPEDGTILRLMHLQAWSGVRPRMRDWAEFSWLPREPAAIGTTGIIGQSEHASRLVVLSTDQLSPLHGKYLDPAGIAGDPQYRYRRPTVSPNGIYMTFFVQDRATGTISLWLGEWGSPAERLESWDYPADARIDVRVIAKWLNNDVFVFSVVTEWQDRYPHRVSLQRLELDRAGSSEVFTLREFQGGGRYRGIELAALAITQDQTHVAYRIRRYTGSDTERNATDAIEVSNTRDLSQSVEISRSGPGEGMVWVPENDWLIAGTGGRLALHEQWGREIVFVTQSEAAFPVLVGSNEVWYQEMESPWRIMRFAINQQ